MVLLIPSGLDARSFIPGAISASELGTLANCQAAWDFSYNQPRDDFRESSAAMDRGTEIHRLVQHYWITGEVIQGDDDTANWLIERYARKYQRLNGWIDVELPFVTPLVWGDSLFGYIDGVQHLPQSTRVWEIKSSAQIADSLYWEESPQLKLYYYAMRKQYEGVTGVTLDLVRTFMPKKDPDSMPLDDSFRRIEITYTTQQMDEFVGQLARACQLRRDIRDGYAPLKNISRSCSGYCSHVAKCFGRTVTLVSN